MLTPYQFASNRPIDGIDLDGLEYFNSTTITYSELGANAGLGYGGATAIRTGTARDMIGKTVFTLETSLWFDQDLEEGSNNPKIIGGAEAQGSIGFEIIKEPVFLKAEQARSSSFPTDVGVTVGAGVGITFSEKVFGFSVGLGIGASIRTGDQDNIGRSISLTYGESDKIAFAENWFGGLINQKEILNKNNEVIGFSAQLRVRDSESSYKQRSYTNITIYSGIKVNENGDKISNEIWQSKDYMKQAEEYQTKNP